MRHTLWVVCRVCKRMSFFSSKTLVPSKPQVFSLKKIIKKKSIINFITLIHNKVSEHLNLSKLFLSKIITITIPSSLNIQNSGLFFFLFDKMSAI